MQTILNVIYPEKYTFSKRCWCGLAFFMKNVKKRYILYEKLYMKLYVNDEKTFVGY